MILHRMERLLFASSLLLALASAGHAAGNAASPSPHTPDTRATAG